MIGQDRITFLRAEGRPKDGADLRSKYNMVYLSFGKDHARASPRPALPGAPPSAVGRCPNLPGLALDPASGGPCPGRSRFRPAGGSGGFAPRLSAER